MFSFVGIIKGAEMVNKSEFIKFLVKSDVISFGDFVTKSGRRTPYFINTGAFSEGSQIARLGSFYADCIIDNELLKPEKAVLFGPAYKGIALAVSTAIALAGRGLHVNYCFNRKEVKDHGEGGSLVGHRILEGDSVLIIEDVITAGTAVREILPIIQNSGAIAEGLVIAVDRMERGTGERSAVREIWEEYGIRTYAVINVRDILEYIQSSPNGHMPVNDGLAQRMESYMKRYCAEHEAGSGGMNRR